MNCFSPGGLVIGTNQPGHYNNFPLQHPSVPGSEIISHSNTSQYFENAAE